MTLTHYVVHLTIGFLIFRGLFGKTFSGRLNQEIPVRPIYVLIFASSFFILSVLFSKLWSLKFKPGPLETLMRKITG